MNQPGKGDLRVFRLRDNKFSVEVLEPRLLKRIIVRTSRSDGHVEEKLVFHGLQTRRTNRPPKFRTLFQIIRLPPLVSAVRARERAGSFTPLTFLDYFLGPRCS